MINILFQDMNILKDYIAYARSYVNPKLSEEAAQYLIQAYVGKKHSLAVSHEDIGTVFIRVLFLWIMMQNSYQIYWKCALQTLQ